MNLKKNISNFLIDTFYYCVFGIFLFVIIFKVYTPQLLNLGLQPFFAFDSSYFDYYQTQHNSIILLLSIFFLQFLNYPVLGSLLITVLLLLLSFVYRKIFEISKNPNPKGIEFIPSILILVSLKSYTIGLETLIIFLLAGLLLLGNRIVLNMKFWIRIGCQIISLVIAFFVFDLLVTFALFAFLIVDEIFVSKTQKKYVIISLNIIILAALIYLLKGFQISKTVFYEAASSNPRISISNYWNIISIHILVILIIGLFSNKKWVSDFTLRIPLFFIRNWVIIFLSALMVVFYSSLFIHEGKYNKEIEYYASIGKWNKVLDYKNKVELNDRISRFLLNQALYHTGRMSEDLFLVPQEWGEHTLILTMTFNRECTIYNSDLFFDMGFIKAAEYWALESQTNKVYSPRILIRLATCALLLKDYPVAHKYLSVLKKSLVYKKSANKMLTYFNDKDVSKLKNKMIGQKKIHHNIVYINNNRPDLNLIQILKEDKNNRMAFEYLMSYYLLQNELGAFKQSLTNYVDGIGFARTPKIYQEALLLYYMSTKAPMEQYLSTIDKNILKRFSQFNKTLIEYNMNGKLARKDLNKRFGDTYWYYVRYLSPKTTGLNIKKRSI